MLRALLSSLVVSVSIVDAPPALADDGAKSTPPSDEQIQMLVEQLDSDSFRDREAAQQKLIETGSALIKQAL